MNTTKDVDDETVPGITEEVTTSWFEKILKIKIDRETFSVIGNSSAGVGFLSNLVRVQFDEILADESKKRHFLVVKLLPSQNGERGRVIAEKMDKTELYFYQKLIPELVHEMPSLKSYFCPFIYGKIQEEDHEMGIPYASALVLKDLHHDGFVLKPFGKECLSREEIVLTIDFLACFHAGGALLELRKQKRLTDIYDIFPQWCYPSSDESPQFRLHEFIKTGFAAAKEVLIHFTETNPTEKDAGNEIISKLIEPFSEHSQKLFNKVVKAGYQYPSILHQDLYQNNILVSSGSTPTIKAIDWQMTGYSDSIYDVAVFLITSSSSKLTASKLEEFAKLYYEKLEKIYSEKEKGGIDISRIRRRSWPQFWQALKTYGATFIFLVYMIGCNTAKAFPENFPKIFEAFLFFNFELSLGDFLHTLLNDTTG